MCVCLCEWRVRGLVDRDHVGSKHLVHGLCGGVFVEKMFNILSIRYDLNIKICSDCNLKSIVVLISFQNLICSVCIYSQIILGESKLFLIKLCENSS